MNLRSRAFTGILLGLIGSITAARADIVCKDNSSGTMKVRTGPNCNSGETKLPIQFLSSNTVVQVTGANLQVVSGAGSTDATVNGLGNVIVGYNENTSGRSRAGSHNVVVGAEHGFSSFSGVVSGESNQVTNAGAAVIGGEGNTASGEHATVTGGEGNIASGSYSSISAGLNNEASGAYAWIGAGDQNIASGAYSSIAGGLFNTASFTYGAIVSGQSNTADAFASAILGGSYNVTQRTQGGSLVFYSTVGGTCDVTNTTSCSFLP